MAPWGQGSGQGREAWAPFQTVSQSPDWATALLPPPLPLRPFSPLPSPPRLCIALHRIVRLILHCVPCSPPRSTQSQLRPSLLSLLVSWRSFLPICGAPELLSLGRHNAHEPPNSLAFRSSCVQGCLSECYHIEERFECRRCLEGDCSLCIWRTGHTQCLDVFVLKARAGERARAAGDATLPCGARCLPTGLTPLLCSGSARYSIEHFLFPFLFANASCWDDRVQGLVQNWKDFQNCCCRPILMCPHVLRNT